MSTIAFSLLVLVWISVGAAVFIDSRQRIRNDSARMLAIALVMLLPFAGAVVYRLIRPPETLAKRTWRRRNREALVGLSGGRTPTSLGRADTAVARSRRRQSETRLSLRVRAPFERAGKSAVQTDS